MSADAPGPIGGVIGSQEVAATLLDHEDETLTEEAKRALWDIFVEIGRCWGNLPDDSISVKSSWLEFIHAKTTDEPSYVGEYQNAIAVVQELIEMYGPEHAFTLLFLRNGIPSGAPTTRLAHAKRYVVDEFIRVQVVAGGFRAFGGPHPLNYNGFIGGSRYNRLPRVRAYIPVTTTTTDSTPKGDPPQ
jgi:hypothetical protein